MDFQINFEELELSKKLFIGKGATGSVIHGRWGGNRVAVKQMHYLDLDIGSCGVGNIVEARKVYNEERRKEVILEAMKLCHLRHPNVVEFYGIAHENIKNGEKVCYLVMKLHKLGDLRKMIEGVLKKHEGFAPLSLEDKLRISAGICRGLIYVHKKGIVHRDLRPKNILLCKEKSPNGDRYVLTAKICDFGLSRNEQDETMNFRGGVAFFVATELKNNPQLRRKPKAITDVFSLGMCLWCLFSEHGSVTLPHYLSTNQLPFLDSYDGSSAEGSVMKLAKKCASDDPNERCKIEEVLTELEKLLEEEEVSGIEKRKELEKERERERKREIERVKRLGVQNKSLKERVGELAGETQVLVNEKAQLEISMRKAKDALKRKNEEKEAAVIQEKKAFEKMKEELKETARNEKEALEAKANGENEEFEKEIAKLKKELALSKSHVHKLEGLNESIHERVVNAEKELNSKNQEFALKINVLTGENETIQDSNKKLRKKLEDQENRLEEQKNNVEKLERDNSKLREEQKNSLEEQKNSLEEQKNSLEEQRKNLEKLKRDNDELREQMSEVKMTLIKKESVIEKQKLKIEKLGNGVSNEKKYNNELREEMRVVKVELNKKESIIEEQKLELEKLGNEKKIIEDTRSAQLREMESHVANLENLKNEIEMRSSREIRVKWKLQMAHNLHYGLEGEHINDKRAISIYKEIESEGEGNLDGCALFNLGVMYEEACGVEKDPKKASEYYAKAAQFYSNKNVGELNPIDWNNMGQMYLYGNGFKKDLVKAVALLKRAVARKNLVAIYNIGRCYRSGTGVEQSDTKAFEFYSQFPDDLDLPKCINALGLMYRNGLGVDIDKKRGFDLYLQAARRGDRIGMLNVGRCYECGYSVEKSVEEAMKWYRKSSELGFVDAGKRLKALETS